MLVKDVRLCMHTLLKQEGFRRGPYGVLLRPIRSRYEMFVGLNTVTYSGGRVVGINPVMGLRDDVLEKFVTELTGHRAIVTLTISLGYLMPERRYIEWEFRTPDLAIANGLLDSIRRFGCPAMESLSSPEAVIEALRNRQMIDNQSRAYRLPAAYFVQGEKESAIQEVRSELAAIRERNDPAAKEYRLFAENLERKATPASEDSQLI